MVTSVDRDDLPDRGAGHWAQTIRALRRRCRTRTVEVLVPDFLGHEEEALATVLEAGPDVFNHNIETCRRIQPKVRIKGDYERALRLLRARGSCGHERCPERGPLLTKSGIVAGMGETDDEVIETMRDLRAHDVDVVTIGQYLQPTAQAPAARPLGAARQLPALPRGGRGDGLRSVFSGPLVRSSYRAEEQQLAARGESQRHHAVGLRDATGRDSEPQKTRSAGRDRSRFRTTTNPRSAGRDSGSECRLGGPGNHAGSFNAGGRNAETQPAPSDAAYTPEPPKIMLRPPCNR